MIYKINSFLPFTLHKELDKAGLSHLKYSIFSFFHPFSPFLHSDSSRRGSLYWLFLLSQWKRKQEFQLRVRMEFWGKWRSEIVIIELRVNGLGIYSWIKGGLQRSLDINSMNKKWNQSSWFEQMRSLWTKSKRHNWRTAIWMPLLAGQVHVFTHYPSTKDRHNLPLHLWWGKCQLLNCKDWLTMMLLVTNT